MTGGLSDLANYGLAGLIFLFMVIPLATIIFRNLEAQLLAKDVEIARMRTSEETMRSTLNAIAPALTEQARVMAMAISLLNERSKP